MPIPLSLCLEHLAAGDGERYVKCTATPGPEAGLGLGASGSILWQVDTGVFCELWVSRDDRLMAYRRADAPEVELRRAGRFLSLPEEKPVVVLHGDELTVHGHAFRVHVHGQTREVTPPTPLRAVRAAAVAAALGVAACGGVTSEDGRVEGSGGTETTHNTASTHGTGGVVIFGDEPLLRDQLGGAGGVIEVLDAPPK